MRKNLTKTIAFAALAACLAMPAISAGAHRAQAALAPIVSVTLNQGTAELKHEPLLEGGAVYLPLRETGALLNSRTTWIADGKKILINRPGVRIEMTLGSRQATVNGKPYALTAMPKNVNGVVFVPVRFVSEALGADVQWKSDDRRVELQFENLYSFAEKGTRGYWLHRSTGELYASENGQAAALVADTEFKLQRYVELAVETLSPSSDVVTAVDNYGEPGINNDVYRFVVASGKLTLETKTHYWGVHPIRNVSTLPDGHALLMDGATLYEVDAAGATTSTHDLRALTGYEDEAFQVEWYDDAYMVVRPHSTGWLTLIDRETNETKRLIDEVATEEKLAMLEELQKVGPNDFDFMNWDGLEVAGRQGDKLQLSFTWFLEPNAKQDVEVPLAR
ncbi:copper amine oxidase N-terminal domain-containing protein [Paenibacillus antri]|uniref:Copper amine oxidase N-terminal domain-containing protein n=1 Tax=Paenibacillus antri TaxID=2582848 RepID=A0A5R9GAV3_9BACL|nr:copper amine oxidase N-terminal domain-containing protein [Paenibacillus antri]TLS53582.1 copper amine oxidase N-terminal domain-containing protein [Paenibacillus antri]